MNTNDSKNGKLTRKLVLNRETLRELTPEEARKVVGADSRTWWRGCGVTSQCVTR